VFFSCFHKRGGGFSSLLKNRKIGKAEEVTVWALAELGCLNAEDEPVPPLLRFLLQHLQLPVQQLVPLPKLRTTTRFLQNENEKLAASFVCYILAKKGGKAYEDC
jgi:hypothetical protein